MEAILNIFNEIAMLRADPPELWRRTKIVVSFKKGDPKLPGNYRPIAMLPILYKLFSRMFCDRITPYIMDHQDVNQAAYRKGFLRRTIY